jgi:hypothetical protein
LTALVLHVPESPVAGKSAGLVGLFPLASQVSVAAITAPDAANVAPTARATRDFCIFVVINYSLIKYETCFVLPLPANHTVGKSAVENSMKKL